LELYTAFWLIHRGCYNMLSLPLAGTTVKVSKEMEIISKKKTGQEKGEEE